MLGDVVGGVVGGGVGGVVGGVVGSVCVNKEHEIKILQNANRMFRICKSCYSTCTIYYSLVTS